MLTTSSSPPVDGVVVIPPAGTSDQRERVLEARAAARIGRRPGRPVDGVVIATPFPGLAELRSKIAALESARREASANCVSSGFPSLDRLLPDGGLRQGTLVEYLTDGPGAGVERLVLAAAVEACRSGAALVVVDHPRASLYPPAAFRLGLAPDRMLLVRPKSEPDRLWAFDQSLRSPGVGAAILWRSSLDGHDFRRLQLAAEQQLAIGLLIRPAAAVREPTWADLRLRVRPAPHDGPGWGVHVEIVRGRGVHEGQGTDLRIPDDTDPLHSYS